MALIKCPDCGAMISSTAASCPHCGYCKPHPKATLIGEMKQNIRFGKPLIVIGSALLPLGLFCMFYLWPLGLLLCVSGGFMMDRGRMNIEGKRAVICPHCGADGILLGKPAKYTCPACKKSSSVVNLYLVPIEKVKIIHYNTRRKKYIFKRKTYQ